MKHRLLTLCFAFLVSLPVTAKDFASQMMDATYKLFNADSTATGFFVRVAPEQPANVAVLVTANHVFEKMSGDFMLIVLRMPQPDGSYRRRDWKTAIRKDGKALWTKHPTLDIAVLPLTLPEDANVTPLPMAALATEETLKQLQLHIASPVFVLGFPSRVEANGAGFPIARHGSIAGFPLTPVKLHETLLLDFATFAGDSGGPVFVKDTRQPDAENAPPILLAAVLAQIRHDEKIVTQYEERTTHHPMQLATAVQAHFIRETIERMAK